MLKDIITNLRGALVATVVLTVVFGLGYPALMTGFAQACGECAADESRCSRDADGHCISFMYASTSVLRRMPARFM